MKNYNKLNVPELGGVHHVTAITSSSEKIYDFFTNVLGLRLVKKTVNQDDINTYHLFFADDRGNAGTDMTFFDFKGIQKRIRGANEIRKTGFRVPSDEAIFYYEKRFNKYNVKYEKQVKLFGHLVLFFEDFDGQEYFLISDEHDIGVESGTPWLKGPVPNEYAITGLGPVWITVNNLELMDKYLTNFLFMKRIFKTNNLSLYHMGQGGNGASVIIDNQILLPQAQQGYGGVHHVAFRVSNNEELNIWIDYLKSLNIRTSGYVDRFYFESLYARIYPNVLFEFATDGPGFIDDEEGYETLGEKLALPPRFRNHREYVESVVKHIDTTRSNKTFDKEYL